MKQALFMLEFVPGTNQYLAMRVKFLAQWNNVGLWWGSNSRLTGIHYNKSYFRWCKLFSEFVLLSELQWLNRKTVLTRACVTTYLHTTIIFVRIKERYPCCWNQMIIGFFTEITAVWNQTTCSESDSGLPSLSLESITTLIAILLLYNYMS